MEGPIFEDTKELCRNWSRKNVNRTNWESSRSPLPFSPQSASMDKIYRGSINSAEDVDKRSHASINSRENLDQECGSSWGHVGEVSPPNSKCSDKISLDMRSGELSPVFDSSVGSLEPAQLRFRDMLTEPNSIIGEDSPDSKISCDIPLIVPVRASSKELSSFANFSPGDYQINRAHEMRGNNFVDCNEESVDIPP